MSGGLVIRSLAITYFHCGEAATIIGADWFHCRVRDGIECVTVAMFTRQSLYSLLLAFVPYGSCRLRHLILHTQNKDSAFVVTRSGTPLKLRLTPPLKTRLRL